MVQHFVFGKNGLKSCIGLPISLEPCIIHKISKAMPAKLEAIEATLKDLSDIFNDWSLHNRTRLHLHAQKVFGRRINQPAETLARLATDTMQAHALRRLDLHLELGEKLSVLALATQVSDKNLVSAMGVLVEADRNTKTAYDIINDISDNVLPDTDSIKTRLLATRANVDTAMSVMDGKAPPVPLKDPITHNLEVVLLYRETARLMTEEIRVHLAYVGALDMHRGTRRTATEMLALRSGRTAIDSDIQRTQQIIRLSKSLMHAIT